MIKYLVTGGAGFIGSHIVDALAGGKNFVRVLDDLSSGKAENLSRVIGKVEFINGDIRCRKTCERAVKGVDFVIHQAALRNVAVSLSRPEAYNEVNIQGTVNLLKAAVKNKVRLFVFASSSSVYGGASLMPQKECHLPQPVSPYALTKLAGEHYCRIFSLSFNLPTICLRYFNVYGPRQALDDQYSSVIPKFINCMLFNRPAPVNGSGRQSRDFVYVADIVKANIVATGKKNLFKGEVVNIAGGIDHSVLDIVAKLNKIMGKNIKPVFFSPRPADVFRTRADLTQAKKKLGFKPATNFDQGLKLTLEYFKEKWQRKQ